MDVKCSIKKRLHLKSTTESSTKPLVSVCYASTANAVIFTNDSGDYYVSDVSLDNCFGPRPCATNAIRARYIRHRGCLLFHDDRKINARRSLSGIFFVETALQERRGSSNSSLVTNDSTITIELTVNEAEMLLDTLESDDKDEDALELFDAIDKQLTNVDGNKSKIEKKWTRILLNVAPATFLSLLRKLEDETLKLRPEMHSFFTSLTERLRLVYEHPYTFSLNKDGTGYDKRYLVSEVARRMTLATWPHDYVYCSPDRLAEAGFFHQPNNRSDDRLLCFACNVCLISWEPTDEPWSEHERHNSNCPHLQDDPSTGNVPVAVTYAFSSALDMTDSLQIDCISRSSNCDWIASSTRDGRIVLFNIEKEFNKTDIIKLDPWAEGLLVGDNLSSRLPSNVKVTCLGTVSKVRQIPQQHSNKKDEKLDFLMIGCDIENEKPYVLIYKIQPNIDAKTKDREPEKIVFPKPTVSFDQIAKTSVIDKKLSDVVNKDLEQLQLATPELENVELFLMISREGVHLLREITQKDMNMNALNKDLYNEVYFPDDVPQESLGSFYVEDMEEFSLDENDDTNADDYPSPPTIIFDTMIDQNQNKATLLDPKSENLLLSTTEDILKIDYEDFKPKIDLSPCQCLILPNSLSGCGFSIKFIEFSVNSSSVFVFMEKNQESLADGDISSALLIYKFKDNLSGLEDTPHQQFNFSSKDLNSKVEEIMLYDRNDKDGIPTDFMIFMTSKGALILLDTRNGQCLTNFTCDEKFTTICLGCNNDIIVGSNSSCAYLIEFEDNGNFFEPSLTRLGKPAMNSSELLSQPLDCQHMESVWELTQSTPLPFADGQWNVHVPFCWSEVPLHRLLRQHTLHGDLSDDKIVKCFRLSPSTDSYKEHLFEVDLSSNVLLDHLNFKFTLRALPSSTSSLQISLLTQLPSCQNQNAFVVDPDVTKTANDLEASKSEIMSEDTLSIDNSRFRIVDGPYELHDVLDGGSLFGLVQFCCPEFLQPNNRTFFVYVRANSTSAGLKRKHVHKKASRLCRGPKSLPLESTDLVDSVPDSSMFLKDLTQFNQKFATPRSASSKFSTSQLSSDQLNGCNILSEVSLALYCVTKSTPNDNLHREILMTNEAYHQRLITSLHEPLHLLFPNATKFHLLVLDILSYSMRNLNSQKKEVILRLHSQISPVVEDVVLSMFLSDSRHLARNFVGFVVDFLKALKSDEEKCDEFSKNICSIMLECAPVFLDRSKSAGCIVLYFALLQRVCQRLDKIVDLRSFTSALQKFGVLMSQKRGNNLNDELSERYRLNGRPFDLELFDFPFNALVWSTRMQKSSSYAGITSQGGTSLTNFVNVLEDDETSWLNFFDLEQDKSDVLPPVHPIHGKSVSSRIDIGREHFYGLLDVEPLSYEFFSASDNVEIEDIKTNERSSILNRGRTSPIAGHSAAQVGSGTVQLRNFASKKKGLIHSTPEKFAQDNAMEVNTLLENAPDMGLKSSSMPATPKTTPYAMTPGPSSPFQLTPPTETVFVQESALKDEFEDFYRVSKNFTETHNDGFPKGFLAPPSPKTVILERMTSLARKFVILDFGRPILLTDVLIPQSADLDSVLIDVWFLPSNSNPDTSENCQPKLRRLVDSNEICRKSLAVCNLRPPALCQYLRITYVGRCGLAPCLSKVSIGSFFGLTCLPPVYGDLIDLEESHATKNASTIKSLRLFAQSLLHRYDSSCQHLKFMLENRQRICDELVILSTLQSVDISTYENNLRKTYEECMSLKIQYNFVRRAVERLLDDDMGARKGGHSLKIAGDFEQYAFQECSFDKLRFVCECLFKFCIRNAFLNNLHVDKAKPNVSNTNEDDIMSFTCSMFNEFCSKGSPQLQGLCCVWLLQQDLDLSFWAKFISKILQTLSTGHNGDERLQRTFLILCYMVQRLIMSGKNSIVEALIEELNCFLRKTDQIDERLIVRLAIILNSALEYYPKCRIVTDKWNFVSGDLSRSAYTLTETSRPGFSSTSSSSLKSKDKTELTVKSLRLSRNLCLDVAPKISSLMLFQSEESSTTSGNVAMLAKLLSSIIRCCRPCLRISDVFLPEKSALDVLVKNAAFHPDLAVRSSFVCILQDFLNIESSRRKKASSQQSLAKSFQESTKHFSAFSPTKKHKTGKHDSKIKYHKGLLNSKSDSKVASTSKRSDKYSKKQLKVADSPDSPENAKIKLEQMIEKVEPEIIASNLTKIELGKRRNVLRMVVREILYNKLAEGLPFSTLESTIKAVTTNEKNYASVCKKEEHYEKFASMSLLAQFIPEHAPYFTAGYKPGGGLTLLESGPMYPSSSSSAPGNVFSTASNESFNTVDDDYDEDYEMNVVDNEEMGEATAAEEADEDETSDGGSCTNATTTVESDVDFSHLKSQPIDVEEPDIVVEEVESIDFAKEAVPSTPNLMNFETQAPVKDPFIAKNTKFEEAKSFAATFDSTVSQELGTETDRTKRKRTKAKMKSSHDILKDLFERASAVGNFVHPHNHNWESTASFSNEVEVDRMLCQDSNLTNLILKFANHLPKFYGNVDSKREELTTAESRNSETNRESKSNSIVDGLEECLNRQFVEVLQKEEYLTQLQKSNVEEFFRLFLILNSRPCHRKSRLADLNFPPKFDNDDEVLIRLEKETIDKLITWLSNRKNVPESMWQLTFKVLSQILSIDDVADDESYSKTIAEFLVSGRGRFAMLMGRYFDCTRMSSSDGQNCPPQNRIQANITDDELNSDIDPCHSNESSKYTGLESSFPKADQTHFPNSVQEFREKRKDKKLFGTAKAGTREIMKSKLDEPRAVHTGSVVADALYSLINSLTMHLVTVEDCDRGTFCLQTILIDCLAETLKKSQWNSPTTFPLESMFKIVDYLTAVDWKGIKFGSFKNLFLAYTSALANHFEATPFSRRPFLANGSSNPRYCRRLSQSPIPVNKSPPQPIEPQQAGFHFQSNTTLMSAHSKWMYPKFGQDDQSSKTLTVDRPDALLIAVSKLLHNFLHSSISNSEKVDESKNDFLRLSPESQFSVEEIYDEGEQKMIRQKNLVDLLLKEEDRISDVLFEILNSCVCGEKETVDAGDKLSKNDKKNIKLVKEVHPQNIFTLADAVLMISVDFFERSHDDSVIVNSATKLLACGMNLDFNKTAGKSSRITPLSKPFMSYLSYLFNYSELVRHQLVESGCVENLARRFNNCSVFDTFCPSPDQIPSNLGFDAKRLSSVELMKKVAHMSRHLQHAGIDAAETHSTLTAKYPATPAPVGEKLKNFGPLCHIVSSSPMTHNLSLLVNQSFDISQRQRRTGAHWSYHFYPVESYLDITFILPYPIDLHQIVIRMNSSALQNNPASVQVECSFDMDPRSFMLLGPVTSTWGQSLVRISTENYLYPTQMVRFHFKRPVESENMNIAQISLLGTAVDISHSEYVMEKSRCLDLLHFCLKFNDMHETMRLANCFDFGDRKDLFFSLLTNILESLIIGRHTERNFQKLTNLFDILCKISPSYESCVTFNLEKMFEILKKYGSIFAENEIWFVELLNTFFFDGCPDERISRLLNNVCDLMTKFISDDRIVVRRTLGLVSWVTSCIIWRCKDSNLSPNFELLFKSTIVLLQKEPSYGELYTSLNHLLNSLCYRHPAFVHQLTSEDQNFKRLLHSIPSKKIFVESSVINTVTSMCEAVDKAQETLKILAAVAQNPPATKFLIENGIIGKIMTILTYLCETENSTSSFKRLYQIGNLVDFLAILSQRRNVASSILNSNWRKFWISIFDYLCKKEFDSETIKRENYQKLNANVMNMVETCTKFDSSSYKLICEILRDCLSKYGLTLFLKSFLIRILLEERSILVVIENSKAYHKNVNFWHPEFGFGIHQTLVELPMDKIKIKHLLPGSTPKHLDKPSPKFDKSSPYLKMTAECPISQASMVCYPKTGSDGRSSKKSTPVTVTPTRAAPDAIRTVVVCEDLLKNVHLVPEETSLAQLMKKLTERSQSAETKKFVEAEPRFLRLKFKETNTADESDANNQFLTQIEPESILLVHFAELGGLALLARYLTLDNIPETKQLVEKRRPPKRMTQKVKGFYPTGYSTDEEDYAYQDYLSGFSPTETVIMPSVTSAKSTSSSKNKRFPTAASSFDHVTICFGLFLPLPGYAPLFVARDSRRAQLLLRLGLGVRTTENGSQISSKDEDFVRLTSLPFEILTDLYDRNSWSDENGRQLRLQSTEMGVLHALLICLEHFGRLKSDQIDRIFSDDEIPHSVKLLRNFLTRESSATSKSKTDNIETVHPTKKSINVSTTFPTSAGAVPPYPMTASSMSVTFPDLAATSSPILSMDPSSTEMLKFLKLKHQFPDVGQMFDMPPPAFSSQTTMPSVTEKSSLLKPPKKADFWAKGTGFGSGSTQRQWNVDSTVSKQKRDEENVACILRVITAFLCPKATETFENLARRIEDSSALDSIVAKDVSLDEKTVQIFTRSCLVAILEHYLRNDSILDISRHTPVYLSVLQTLCAISACSQLRHLLTLGDESGNSIFKLVEKMRQAVEVYSSKIGHMKTINVDPSEGTVEKDECLAKLTPLVNLSAKLLENFVPKNLEQNRNRRASGEILSKEQLYTKGMKSLQYKSIQFFQSSDQSMPKIAYNFAGKLPINDHASALNPRIRRLAQEIVTLSTSLPLNYSSSVFVRSSEERLDAMKVLITGPEDTPYAGGCFEFDVFFPSDYPASPMDIRLMTTGNGTVRFNPNLYNDGKVCLSILNTWHGSPEEKWNPQTSNLLQVLVSIQSLIFVPDPYFNEPGFERTRQTANGQQASRDYNFNIRIATVRWAMIEMLRNPAAGFEEVVRKHFHLKKDDILKTVERWIEEMNADINIQSQKGSVWEVRLENFQALKRLHANLKLELLKLESLVGAASST